MELEALFLQARQFDNQALAALHDQLYPVVYRYVRFQLDDEQLVEDITSETFLRMLDVLHKDEKEIRNLRSWMLGTASHLIQDHLRLKYRRAVDDIDEHEHLPDGKTATETLVEQAFRKEEVRLAFQNLTADQQNVLALRFSQEMSLEETAQSMGRSVNAVKVLQFRALESLRRLLNIDEQKR